MGDCVISDILDISYENGTSTMTKKKNWTVEEIETALKALSYNGQRGVKDELVERSKMPSMAGVFFSLLFLNGEIPSEDLFFEQYLTRCFNRLDRVTCELKAAFKGTNKHNIFSIQGVRGRVLRTFPSLIRDFHFYVLCSQSGVFERVVYSLATDCLKGLDLEIWHGGKQYFVSLFTNTARSNAFKSQKYRRHEYGVSEICISIDWTSRNQIGAFWLYGEEHLNQVVREIEQFVLAKEA